MVHEEGLDNMLCRQEFNIKDRIIIPDAAA